MEKKLKNLITKKQKFYNIGISNSDIGTKYGTFYYLISSKISAALSLKSSAKLKSFRKFSSTLS